MAKGMLPNFTSNIKRTLATSLTFTPPETIGFLVISGEIEVNKFAYIREIFEVKSGDDP